MKGKTIILALTLLLGSATLAPTATAAVTANAGPDKTLDVGSSTTFSGTASSATGESIASYNWDFGDGSTATGSTRTKTYTQAGTYTVTLVVVGTGGSTSTDTAAVTVRTTDTTAPNITHTMPSSASANAAIGVTSTVTDNIGILGADVYYKRSTESTFVSTSMTCAGSATSKTCNGTIPASVTDGAAVHYYIRARDTQSPTANTNTYPSNAPTSYLTLSLSDATPPTITHTPPSGATDGVDLTITATLADNVAVDAATVYYSFDGTNAFGSSVDMTLTSGTAASGTWSATIDGASLSGSTIEYYIEATDTSDRTSREPSAAPGCFSASTCTSTALGISSANAPTITHTATTTATAGAALSLTATVAPGSGRTLSSVVVAYRALGSSDAFSTATMTPNVGGGGQAVYTGSIPGAAIGDAGVEYYIAATDSASDVTNSPSAGASSPTQVTTPPGTPTGLSAARTSAGAVLAWTAPATAADDTAASYRVYRSVGGSTYTLLASPTTTTYTDAAEGVAYHYKVSAVDAHATEGAQSSAVQLASRGALPAMPALALTPSTTSIAAAWSATAPAGGYYLVHRSTNNASFTQVANVTAVDDETPLSASVADLVSATAYFLRVTPYNAYHEAGSPAFRSTSTTSDQDEEEDDDSGGGGGGGGGDGGGSGGTPTTDTTVDDVTGNATDDVGDDSTVDATDDVTGNATGDAGGDDAADEDATETDVGAGEAANDTASDATDPLVEDGQENETDGTKVGEASGAVVDPAQPTPAPKSRVPGFELVGVALAAALAALVARRRR